MSAFCKMEILIETLTGTAFELRVSPFETVMGVKSRIQRLEGIPISQQHLIWQSTELQDDYCLHDYNIYDGATLKLVLAMRGGPINTRRIPMEDPTFREMAEYVEANRDDIWEKVPGNRQVTILVFREGDQFNFFRFVDRGDGSLTPLSESYSGTSLVNEECEEEEEVAGAEGGAEKIERDWLKEKMQTLKEQMDKLALEKLPCKRPTSGRLSAQSRRQSRPSSNSLYRGTSLTKAPCLPPVGQTLGRHLSKDERVSSTETEELNFNSSDGEISPADPEVIINKLTSNIIPSPEPVACGSTETPDPLLCSKPVIPSTSLIEATPSVLENSDYQPDTSIVSSDTLINQNRQICRPLTSTKRDLAPLRTSTSAKKDITFDVNDFLRSPTQSAHSTTEDTLPTMSNSNDILSQAISKQTQKLQSLKEALMRSSSKYDTRDPVRDLSGLESLTSTEARVMSGLLRQTSVEKLGTSRLDSFLPSVSAKSRLGNYTGTGLRTSRRQTPEASLASSLLRMSAQRESRISPTYRLPPVKSKKKSTKRCLFCAKKTGLATSYVCRCGNNFCATHRYAESHGCSYDYKTEGRRILEQNNPVVAAPKLPKI